jgi:antitoxin FitA
MLAKEVLMGQILVRNIDDTLKSKLQQLAKKHGHSMEQEVRTILRNAVKDAGRPEKGLGTRIAERFKGLELDRDIPELRGFTIKPPTFD